MEASHVFAMQKLAVPRVNVPGTGSPTGSEVKSSEVKQGDGCEGGLEKIIGAYCDKPGVIPSCVSSPVAGALCKAANNSQLVGANDAEKASVMQYLFYCCNELEHHISGWVKPTQQTLEGCNPGTVAKSKALALNHLKVLDGVLVSRTYLVTERVTLADIYTCMTLLPAFQFVLDENVRKSLRHVTRWFNTIINQPQVKKVLGDVKMCETEAKALPPKSSGGKEKAKGGDNKGKGDSKAKKVEKAKDEPKAEPKPEKMEVEEGSFEKKKDPLDSLPKGTFDLEDYKRFYSNNDEDKSIAYFWDKFDAENYSIWRADYRYNDELALVFMSCNLIGGMFQRLEKLKKHAFASVCLFGKDNDSSISGLWVWKGQDLVFEKSEDMQVDYSSYSWKKLDPKDDNTKKLVDQYWKWEGTDEKGRTFNQGKIFK